MLQKYISKYRNVLSLYCLANVLKFLLWTKDTEIETGSSGRYILGVCVQERQPRTLRFKEKALTL